MIIPSDNSLLVWRIIDENNRTHCIVFSLKFDFHLMGVHLPAFKSEELAPDDILGGQLYCASSAVSTFLHHSLLLSFFGPAWVQEFFFCSRKSPRFSVSLKDFVAVALDGIVVESPKISLLDLRLVSAKSCLIAKLSTITEFFLIFIFGLLESITGTAVAFPCFILHAFNTVQRALVIPAYNLQLCLMALALVSSSHDVLLQLSMKQLCSHSAHHYATSPPKMKPPIMTIAITAAKPTMVSKTSP